MTEIIKQLYYTASQDLSQAPKSIRLAIRTNLIITCWLPTVAMAISDYYLGRIPNLVVIIFTVALFVLFTKMYEDTTRFSRHSLLIHLTTFSTLAMFFLISYYKDWPLELVIAESVAVEILAFLIALVFLYVWMNMTNRKKIAENEMSSNDNWKKQLQMVLLVLAGLVAFVGVIYFRFEGVLQYFLNELLTQPSEAIYLIVPFLVVVIKYLFICYNHVMDKQPTQNKSEELDIISLNYGVPMLLNLLVPFVMYVTLYYVPKT
jgi:hypothetical protein